MKPGSYLICGPYSDIFGELVDLFNGNVAFPGPPGGTPWPTDPDYVSPGLDTPNNLRTDCSFSPEHEDGVRWLSGEDAVAFGGAIRDMWEPTCMGDPDRAYHPYQTCSPFDNGGVHSGSAIPNHAFAILTDGVRPGIFYHLTPVSCPIALRHSDLSVKKQNEGYGLRKLRIVNGEQ